MTRTLLSRFRSLFRRDALESTLDDEVRTHREHLAADYERGGSRQAGRVSRHAARSGEWSR
jgi:hypothetical protein